MMLYPPVADLVDKVGSRYQLVNVVAQRARNISAEAEAAGEPLDEKPVSIAIDEVYAGKLTITHNAAPVEAEEETEAVAEE
ncbi:MAG: DNA-directed RNA polymerase subunit omega [Oscillospiraceae bacterium]|nr:DNA-directed RNA polymerase subunit omega [Oscillospiraceae bacterium]